MGIESCGTAYPTYCGCKYCPWCGTICVACWQFSTEKLVGMLTYTLFMVPSGKQQLVCDLVGGGLAPELALELELAAVLD